MNHSFHLIESLGALLLLTVLVMTIRAVDCEPSSDITSELKNRQPAADGKIHVTYSFNDPNISDASKNAILNAIGQWNAESNSTRVVFELAAPNAAIDLEFKASTNVDDTGGCAGFRSASGRVYYSPAWEQRAAGSQANGATVIAHELGHYLGLDEGARDSDDAFLVLDRNQTE